MWKGIKEFFGFSGVASSALKIVDKIAGTDWTPKEKAEYTLKYMEATKHQSPARRLIATGIMIEHVALVAAWLGSTLIGNGTAALEVSKFMSSNINITLDIIIGFYFLSGMAKR